VALAELLFLAWRLIVLVVVAVPLVPMALVEMVEHRVPTPSSAAAAAAVAAEQLVPMGTHRQEGTEGTILLPAVAELVMVIRRGTMVLMAAAAAAVAVTEDMAEMA
jgi:hypothetical protein